jgi:hypothetical protein
MRDERRRPLGPASARKVLTALGAILDDAVEDDLIESNPARGKQMRVRVPKPNRTFLEMDELALLLDAAGIQDRLPEDMRLPQEPVWGAFIRSGALAASVRAARSRLKPTLACSPRVPSRAGNDRPRESGKTAAFQSPIEFWHPTGSPGVGDLPLEVPHAGPVAAHWTRMDDGAAHPGPLATADRWVRIQSLVAHCRLHRQAVRRHRRAGRRLMVRRQRLADRSDTCSAQI